MSPPQSQPLVIMPGMIKDGTATAITAAKSTLSPLLGYLQSASTMTGKAWLVAAGAARDSATSALNYIVQKDSTGLIRIGISRLEAGDKASWLVLGTTVFASYALLCSALRFRRRDQMVKKYGYHDRASMAKMTTTEAQEIIQTLTELEWPTIFLTSIEFALFKTYGIPTISGLLNATKEFYNPNTSSKRLADTSVLIGEFVSHPPTAERSIKAISRMNFIHSPYQQSGKISHEDLLYTLSVFMTEPVRWVERYEWRTVNPMEICAIGTFWKGIADDMAIDYQRILEGGKSGKGWKDGIEFWEDVAQWARGYEEKCMVPAVSNQRVGDETANLLLNMVPMKMRPVAKKTITVLMEPRLRRSMMYDDPPASYVKTVHALVEIRRFYLRYLALPKPSFMRTGLFSKNPDPKTGRYFYKTYKDYPYYNKPTFWNRWGPMALVWRAIGGTVPGDKKWHPQGYVFEEVGPNKLAGKGKDKTDEWEQRLKVQRTPGCPFRR